MEANKLPKLNNPRKLNKLRLGYRDYRRTYFEAKRNAYNFQSKPLFFITSNYIKDGLNAIMQSIQYLLIVSFSIYLVNKVYDPSLFINDEGRT